MTEPMKLGQSGVRPTDAEMVALGEKLVEAARAALDNEYGWSLRLKAAANAWNEAMTDRFMGAIEDGQR